MTNKNHDQDTTADTVANTDNSNVAENKKILEEVAKLKKNINKDKAQEELELTEQVSEAVLLKEQLLRLAADMDNIKKRHLREVDNERKFAISNFANDLIEVMENLYRATEFIDIETRKDPKIQLFVEGIEATQRALRQAFEKNGIQRIEPEAGSDFDHNVHQVMTQFETAEYEEGQIAQVLQAGYLIKDRLLRPALVAIAKKKA